ncbi:MAG: YibE/F family protein [Oscillospiraceae bacterium]|jgi:uncharacterized membrane protein|nr:YibE/F family protein [Oscillospiraceae bacterium]
MPKRKTTKPRTANKINRHGTVITVSVLAVMVISVLAINKSSPFAYSLYNTDIISYEKGTVSVVLEEYLESDPDLPGQKLGYQKIRVKLKNGPMRGEEIELEHYLYTTHSVLARKGLSVIIKADRPENVEPYYSVYNYDRVPGLSTAIIIFVAFIFLVGGLKGLRSLLGLAVSLFFILVFLLPAICRGWSPVLVTLVTGTVIVSFSLLLLNGFSRKTFTALAATVSGVLLSGFFFALVSALTSLTGYNIDEAEALIMVSRETGLRIGEVLFAGVIIASLGAVMDTTVSLAAAMYEIEEQSPGISPRKMFLSGMTMGRDIIGANCMTLILAFVGSSLAALLSLAAYGTQFNQLISSNYLAVEVAYAFTGGLAVVVAVPITAGLCVIQSKNGKKTIHTRKSRK